ncbi:NAD(P)-dependent oxidoreductase [Streptomyces sp. NPDC002088]|uniref:NAD(P)-dependent oxidoreductase n=1 Tax=Streptomyces sp. NPDC002088 TaxID=3154665 RepID=UPI00332CD874
MSLRGATLGVLSLGRLGTAVAEIGSAFGMQTIAWSQNLTPADAQAKGTEYVSRDEFFRRSDVLSIHVILSERTRGLVGERELGLMKSTAILVNTSRGPGWTRQHCSELCSRKGSVQRRWMSSIANPCRSITLCVH